MIREMKPLTLDEAKKVIEKNEGMDLSGYFKKYVKVKTKEVEEMRKELSELNNHKIKDEHIVKIIDLLPEDSSEVNKIFTDVSLDENEIKQVTDIVAKHK